MTWKIWEKYFWTAFETSSDACMKSLTWLKLLTDLRQSMQVHRWDEAQKNKEVCFQNGANLPKLFYFIKLITALVVKSMLKLLSLKRHIFVYRFLKTFYFFWNSILRHLSVLVNISEYLWYKHIFIFLYSKLSSKPATKQQLWKKHHK